MDARVGLGVAVYCPVSAHVVAQCYRSRVVCAGARRRRLAACRERKVRRAVYEESCMRDNNILMCTSCQRHRRTAYGVASEYRLLRRLGQ
eukprot:2447428-Prymnesium_polylepis.1